MIIDKLKPFWTEEEAHRQAEIQQEADSILASVYDAHTHGESATEEQAKRLQELTIEEQAIREAVHERYIKGRSAKQLVADAKEIIEAIDQADFKKFIADQRSYRATLRAEGTPEDELAILNPFSVESFENCYSYIDLYVTLQKAALELMGDTAGKDMVRAYIRKRAALWYEEKRPANLPIVHAKAVDELAFMSTRSAEIDPIAHKATINRNGVKLELDLSKLTSPKAQLGVSTDKLLKTALNRFTAQNDFTHAEPGKLKRGVTIPLKEYAQLLGYDVEEHPTSTPEEAAREKKRAKAQLDNARRVVQKDQSILAAATLTWTETVKGKQKPLLNVNILSAQGVPHGQIVMVFNEDMAAHLAGAGLITYFPAALYKIRADQKNAYYMGLKTAEHYYMYSNQERGTYNKLKIETLLDVTDLPSYDEVMRTDRHWERRIKEPLEHNLDILKQVGYLKSWEYTHAKGIALTEEEAYNITSYQDFKALYLQYELESPIDNTERIEAKKQQRAIAAKRKATKKKS